MVKLMNSAMMPQPGNYELMKISRATFCDWLRTHSFESYIGYPSTAWFIQRISGVPISVSRAPTLVENEDVMLIVRLKYRVQSPGDKGKFTPTDDDYEFLLCKYTTLA